MDRQCLLNLVAEGILVLRTASMKFYKFGLGVHL